LIGQDSVSALIGNPPFDSCRSYKRHYFERLSKHIFTSKLF
jgi:hypothetical protein